jgi:hypothetical protein
MFVHLKASINHFLSLYFSMMQLLAVQNVMLVEALDAGIITGNPGVF